MEDFVLIAIFSGRLGSFGVGLNAFGDASKTCSSQAIALLVDTRLDDKCGSGETSISSSDGPGQGKKCCKSVSSTCGGFPNSICKLTCGTPGSIPGGNSECSKRDPLKPRCCVV